MRWFSTSGRLPQVLAQVGTLGVMLTLDGVVPESTLRSNFSLDVAITLGMALVAAGTAGIFWHGLREGTTRTTSDALSFGFAWFLTAAYFVAVLSFVYWALSLRDPHAFTQRLSHDDAIYFALSTFTTTGFGDISPVSAASRLAVSIQMLGGFGIVAVGLSLALSHLSRLGIRDDPLDLP
jgi:Ion channel